MAVKAGTAKIYIKTHNNLSATLTVKVYNAPSKVTLSPTALTLGEEMRSALKVTFPSKTYSLYRIESSDESVVRVSADGSLYAAKAGTAVVTVTTANGKTARCAVTVLAAPDTIGVNAPQIVLGMGEPGRKVTGTYPQNTMCDFVYASENEGVAKVNAATGELTAVSEGTAKVIVTSANSKAARAECEVVVKKAPTDIALEATTLQLGKGNSYSLLESGFVQNVPSDAHAGYSFKTSNKKIVTVTEDGILKGVKAGSATITVTTHNGVKKTLKVTVYNAPSKVTLSPTALELGVGMRSDLKVTFPSKTYSLYSLGGYDKEIISVSEDGAVQALKEGATTVTVTTANGKTASCKVTVHPAPTFVEFLSNEYEVAAGMSVVLDPIMDEGAMASFIFTSSDPTVATIDANGKVTGVRPGRTDISVRAHNGVSNTMGCTVVVTPAPSVLDYNDLPTLVVSKGDVFELPEPIALDANGNECPSTFSFKSSNTKVVSVSDGQGKALKAGTVTITAKSYNGKTATFKIKVSTAAIEGLELTSTEEILYTDGKDYVEFLFLNGRPTGSNVNYGSLSFESSNANVAYVSPDGIVAAIAPGDAIITARTFNGKSATCTIHVRKLSSTLKLNGDQIELGVTETFQLQPVFDEGASARLLYTSSNSAVATVDENGSILAVASGDAVITAEGQNGLTASIHVHVLPSPTGIFLNAGAVSLAIGEEVTLTPELTADSAEYCKKVSFVSDNERVVTVSASGRVKALASGETIITARTCNGLEARCAVTVLEANVESKASFSWETATIVVGDSAALNLKLNKAAIERGYTVTSSAPEALSVDGNRIVAKAASEEAVTLTLSVNAAEGEAAPEPTRCNVKVVESISPAFSASNLELEAYNEATPEKSVGALTISGLPADLIGTYALTISDEAIMKYDPKAGEVRALDQVGVATISLTTYQREIRCTVSVVNPVKYRAVIFGEYNNSSDTVANLPFVSKNVASFRAALETSNVNGALYEITSYANNPSEAQIKSGIASAFADADENDVSVVYIVSHGYNDSARGGYHFGTPNWKKSDPSTYITSAELMSWLSAVNGNVVLVLDSCKSGAFIDDCRSKLSAAGNIAVMTAQVGSKNASYYVGTTASNQIEFMTYAFCKGLGYDLQYSAVGAMAADADSDGSVTVQEAIAYAKSETTAQVNAKKSTFNPNSKYGIKVPGCYTSALFKSWGGQTPVTCVPDGMKDLVLYSR